MYYLKRKKKKATKIKFPLKKKRVLMRQRSFQHHYSCMSFLINC